MPKWSAMLGARLSGPSAGEQALFRRVNDMENALMRRALAAEEKLERLSRRMEEVVARLENERQGPGAEGLSRRLEEIAAYFAQRTHGLHHTHANYLGDHTALTLLHGRHMLYVDTRDIGVAPHLMVNGIWETPCTTLFERLLRPGTTVLDIGANLGVYTVLAAAANARVHAFEPNPRFCDLLRRSASVNGLTERLALHPVAVSDTEDEVRLAVNEEWPGGGHVAPVGSTAPGPPCRLVVLDRLLPDPSVRLDLVKMDVEGHEGRALRGMRALLARSPDVRIMMEFAPQMMAIQGMTAAETVGLLGSFGFRFWEIGGDSGLTPIEPAALAAGEGPPIRNILVARDAP